MLFGVTHKAGFGVQAERSARTDPGAEKMDSACGVVIECGTTVGQERDRPFGKFPNALEVPARLLV
jgi:hypothetical protein